MIHCPLNVKQFLRSLKVCCGVTVFFSGTR